jgi:hypothetical protein
MVRQTKDCKKKVKEEGFVWWKDDSAQGTQDDRSRRLII